MENDRIKYIPQTETFLDFPVSTCTMALRYLLPSVASCIKAYQSLPFFLLTTQFILSKFCFHSLCCGSLKGQKFSNFFTAQHVHPLYKPCQCSLTEIDHRYSLWPPVAYLFPTNTSFPYSFLPTNAFDSDHNFWYIPSHSDECWLIYFMCLANMKVGYSTVWNKRRCNCLNKETSPYNAHSTPACQ